MSKLIPKRYTHYKQNICNIALFIIASKWGKHHVSIKSKFNNSLMEYWCNCITIKEVNRSRQREEDQDLKYQQSNGELTIFFPLVYLDLNSTHWQRATRCRWWERQEKPSSSGSRIWKKILQTGSKSTEISYFLYILHFPVPQPTAICHVSHSQQQWDRVRAKASREKNCPLRMMADYKSVRPISVLLSLSLLPNPGPGRWLSCRSAWQRKVTEVSVFWTREREVLTNRKCLRK